MQLKIERCMPNKYYNDCNVEIYGVFHFIPTVHYRGLNKILRTVVNVQSKCLEKCN